MSSVFAGHDTVLDRPVALKILNRPAHSDDRATQRLLWEAKVTARIIHAACVRVFDGGVDPEVGAFLVMERLDGEDLRRFLHQHGPLPVSLALGMFEQIGAIVHAVHQAGVVHRDLKPGNVFVLRGHPFGAVPRIKLLDFGIAKSDDSGEAQLTEPGEFLGTLAYAAPERWLSPTAPDARTDIYALGALLYEMLSGNPPFRAETKAALRLAVLNDRPPPLLAPRNDLPAWLSGAIERTLCKSPAERFADVPSLMGALGLDLVAEPTPTLRTEQAFRGTERFRVERCLSRGADTEVYAVLDLERNQTVALKRLANPRGEAFLRLKREFRTVADIRHPNLVRLGALWKERDDLLMTMEFVDGVPLLDHVAGSEERLRSCLGQLVSALQALHARGLVHRDVKLENIIVDRSGRLVLLDHGLAMRWQETGAPVTGTAAYLAPEVLEGRSGPAGDLYAVGVILRAALTGKPPRTLDGPLDLAGAEIAIAGPDDLRALCMHLHAADPAARPSAAEILDALADRPAGEATRSSAALAPGETFVGRAEALAFLDRAIAAAADGTPHAVWIEGESGIGKSALLDHLRRQLAQRPDTLVLTGRARHGDAVPFPALDEVIDDLCAYLMRLPPAVAEVLMPKRAAHIARLFPGLAALPAIARDLRNVEAKEATSQMRRLAFDGLRELFKRITDSRSVVVILDDLQWIDADSRALLAHLLDGSGGPPLLVLGGVRSTTVSPELRKLAATLGTRVQRIALGALSHEESCALLHARWRGQQKPDDKAMARLANEGHGIPFFLEVLASSASVDHAGQGCGLDQVLANRVDALPAKTRLTLEMVCVASRPLPVETVLAAAQLGDVHELDPLLAEPFLRSVRSDRRSVLEPYHDKIRDAVRAALPEAAALDHHRALAAALESGSQDDPEHLIEHLAASGEAVRATKIALAAAELASDQLAFDRAAALFAVALEHGVFSKGERLALQRRRARALQLAYRRRECGEILLRAAEDAPDDEAAARLHTEAGVHLLYSGDVRRGLEALQPALSRAGLRVPTSLEETIAATTKAMGAIASGGLAARQPEGTPSQESLDRVELCLVLSQGLAHIDLRVLPFACEGLLAALEAGDACCLQRAAALFVINSVEYLPNPLVAPVLALCRRLTEADPTPYARASLDAAIAENAHFEGDFLEAEAAFERAERALLDSCPEATRELATVRDLAVFVQYAQKGDFATQLDRTQRWLAEADAAQDVYHASMLRVAHAIVWIAHDQPARARAELRRAQEEWLGEAGVLEVGAALYHDIIDRYEEKDLASDHETSARSALLRSPAADTPFLGGYLRLQQAWKELRALAAGTSDARAGAALVTEIVSGLRANGLTIWSAVADVLEANLAFLNGDREPAVRGLDSAETKFKRAGMACLAACARRRRGEFLEGELGSRLRAEADAELHRLGVANIERWTRAYWSMFDAEAARARTANGARDEPPLTTAGPSGA
jgi:serine/threonine protein kinase